MKKTLLILSVLFIAGCDTIPLTRTIHTERIVYPELPPVPAVAKLTLIPCIPDRPRKYWEPLQVKSNTQCKKRLQENPNLSKNSKFQKDCMEYPIDTKSNIVIGFDIEGEKCYTLNTEKIRRHIYVLQERIKDVNRQRTEWIKRNEDKRNSKTVEE